MFRSIANLFRSRPINADGRPYERSVLQKAGRAIGLLATVCLGAIASLVGGLLAHNQITYEIPKSNISVSIRKDTQRCSDPRWPYLITVTNNSKYTIRSMNIRLNASYPGRSTNYADYLGIHSDLIIRPTYIGTTCWMPALSWTHDRDPSIRRDELVWTVANFTPVFQ